MNSLITNINEGIVMSIKNIFISSLIILLGFSLFGQIARADASLAETRYKEKVTSVISEDFMISTEDPAIKLFVRNKRHYQLSLFSQSNVVLFVHGATYPSETGFDLRLDGISWMDVLALQGFDVYFLDLRGYGKSTRPASMDLPANLNPPIVNTDIAALDYAAAAKWVRERRNIDKLNVIGHSWGTVITSLYATREPQHVHKLVLYAPVWNRQTPSLTDSGGALGAYRVVTIEQARKRKETGLRPGVKPQPDAWFEKWAQETFTSDPVGSSANPKFVRAPNGVIEDSRKYWGAGKPMIDPSDIKVPTLLVLGEWDADTPPYMAQNLFPLLTNAHPKKLSVLSRGTHGMMNEIERFHLFTEVFHFLNN
ncbi:MAG: alpha/beta hydrolase [Betaproteobacteria bacterium]|nr:alpha/beta hydrolase [Betaproteobacteria bacterium]